MKSDGGGFIFGICSLIIFFDFYFFVLERGRVKGMKGIGWVEGVMSICEFSGLGVGRVCIYLRYFFCG